MEKEGITLKLISGYIEGQELVFSAWNERGLFKYNLKTNEIKLLTILPTSQTAYGYGFICKDDDVAYLSPCHANSLLCINTNSWEIIDNIYIDDNIIGVNDTRYGYIASINDKVVIQPYSAHAVIVYNKKTKKMDYFDDCFIYIKQNYGCYSQFIFLGETLADNELYFVCQQNNLLIEFDVEKRETSYYPIGSDKDLLNNVVYDGEDFWIYTNAGDLFRWNKKSGIKSKYDRLIQQNADDSSICIYKGRIWIAGKSMYECVSVNIETGNVVSEEFYRNVCEKEGSGSLKIINDKMFYFPNRNDYIYSVDVEKKTLHGNKIILQGDEYRKYIDEIIRYDTQKNSLVYEKHNHMMTSFLEQIQRR